MPDVRFGIDASSAQQGFSQLSGYLRTLGEQAKQTQAAVAGATGGGSAEAVAVRERLVRTTRAQADASTQLLRVQQQQLRVGLTALSTLGEESRAYAQLTSWHIRRAQSMGQEINVGALLAETRKRLAASDARAAEIFSVGAVRARDLRINMAGLNQSMAVIAATLTRINPALGATVSLMSRAGRAAGNLSGGFALLGPLVGILTVAAAGMTALAVAGDRTGQIPRHIKGIVDGLIELARQAGEASGATQVLVGLLERAKGLLPTPRTALQSAEERLAELRGGAFGQALQRGTSGLIPGANARAIAEQEAEVTRLRREAHVAYIQTIDEEARIIVEHNKRVSDLQVAYARGELGIVGTTEATKEYDRVFGLILEKQKQEEKALARRQSGYKDTQKAVSDATEAQKAYNNALAQFREEEERATLSEQERLADLKVSNELLQKEIAATRQGTEALQAFNVEKAVTLELERQRESGADLTKAESDALVDQVRRQQQLNDELKTTQDEVRAVGKANDQAARDSMRVWDNAIDNIQKGFGDLFTSLVLDGKDAFDNLGDTIKSMFSRIVGELLNANVFGPLFKGLAGATGSAQTGGFSSLFSLEKIGTVIGNAITKAVGGGVFQGPATAGGVPPASPAGAVLGQLAGALPFGVAGALAGALSGGSDLERIGKSIGAGIGAALGAAVGSGLGPVGALAGGFLGQQFFGGIQGLQQGIDVPKSALQVAGVYALTTGFGLPVGIILLAIAAAMKKEKFGLGLATAPTRAGLPGLESGIDITRETPFGFIGVPGSITSNIFGQPSLIAAFLDTVEAIDNALAQHLSAAEEEIIKQSGALASFGHQTRGGSAQYVIQQQRMVAVLRTLGIPEETIGTINFAGSTESTLTEVTGLLAQRAEVKRMIDQLSGLGQDLTQAEQAIEEIRKMADAVKLAAPSFGLITGNVAELEEQAIGRLRTGFNESIADQILAIQQPFELMLRQLARETEDRLKEAEVLGGDLVEIERLSGLKRAELIRNFNDPLKDLLDTLRVTPSGQSPTAALLAAQAQFNEAEAAARGGSFSARGDLAQSAQALLGLSEQFLGGPGVATERDRIVAVLSELTLTMGGTAADTGAQLADLNSLTAAGNAANEQLLLRVIDRLAAIENENVLLRESLERLNAA